MINKCKTRVEIATEYGVDRKTLAKMLKRNQIELPRGLLPPEWVEKVYAALGTPDTSAPPPLGP
ncbi:MAG: hypothetical protein ACKVU2_03320 [Saprospiraceae bacterium]